MKLVLSLGAAGALALGVANPATAQAVPDSLPAGVTAGMVQTGMTLFNGAGICMACHGNDGKGMGGLAADLTDAEWVHGDGSYESIIQQITAGVDASASSNGVAMPPRGGSSLTDDQIRSVAAYVWTLSRVGG